MAFTSFSRQSLLYSLSFIGIIFASCTVQKKTPTNEQASYTIIQAPIEENKQILQFIAPYQTQLDNALSTVLAYNPEKLDKAEGKWQNKMTNFFADAVLEEAQQYFYPMTNDSIDFCLLNYGGIRSTIPQGAITTRTSFEIMPFENEAIVLKLNGKQVYELAHFILDKEVAHPLGGIKIISKNNSLVDVLIHNTSVDFSKNYWLVTNDYLSKGGDWMDFLTRAKESQPLRVKIRDLFTAYFTKIDTLKPSTEPRILFQ